MIGVDARILAVVRRPAIDPEFPEVLALWRGPRLAGLDFRVSRKGEGDHSIQLSTFPSPLAGEGGRDRRARPDEGRYFPHPAHFARRPLPQGERGTTKLQFGVHQYTRA